MIAFIIVLALFGVITLCVHAGPMNFFTDFTFMGASWSTRLRFLLIVLATLLPIGCAAGAFLFPSAMEPLIGIGLLGILLFIFVTEYLPLGIPHARELVWSDYMEIVRKTNRLADMVSRQNDPLSAPGLNGTWRKRYVTGKFRKLLAYHEVIFAVCKGTEPQAVDVEKLLGNYYENASFCADRLDEGTPLSC